MKKYLFVNLPYFLVLLFVILYSSINLIYFKERVPVSPDESQVFFFSDLLSRKYTLKYQNPLNSKYNEKIFAARQYVQIEKDTVPSAFLGFIIIVSIFKGINSSLINFVGPILSGLSLFYIFKLSNLIFGKKTAIITLVLQGIFPVFIYWTLSFFNNISELPFLIGGLYYLFNALRKKSVSFYIVTAVFFALSIWIRYTNILLIPLIYLVSYLFFRKSISLTGIIYTLLTFIVLILPLFISNNALYGNFFVFGQNSKNQLVYKIADTDIPKEILPLVPFRDIKYLIKNTQDYILTFIPVLILSASGFLFFIKQKTHRKELFILIGVCVFWGFYYLGGVYFGYGSEPILNSSYTRYLLIVYSVLIIFVSYFIHSINSRLIQVSFLSVLIVSFINITLFSSRGLVLLKGQIESSVIWLKNIEQNTSKKSIIFAKAADKVLFPKRNIALYQMLSEKEEFSGQGITKTLELMKTLLVDNHEIYFLNEDKSNIGIKSEEYLNRLSEFGLKASNYNVPLGLYQITLL